ncbi:conserved Plasmodium protein, unknown function [Babesia microti strain RI]|uniref:Uncharacterized protein n=1 Tax=Babesia microti (strain RI) TaxID=1133968 RepID=A0A1N6LWV9_BABMR|nr:conserved Plasmodium protein, unknown function [Babesia microti strain RI]SIO73353.1 conserved Plasmodium protein, unknown function [Babesia microti strain RI]|eukprot:XP_021337455.1 conserved Plasmodium protein, unknown function [Babesia microti strain RI]
MDERYSYSLFSIPYAIKPFQSNPFKAQLLDTPETHSLFRTHLSNIKQSLNGLEIKSLTTDDHIRSLYILSICYKFEPFNSKSPDLSLYASSLITKIVFNGNNHSDLEKSVSQFFELLTSNVKTWDSKVYQLYYLCLELLVKKGYRSLKGFSDNLYKNSTFAIITQLTKLFTEDFLCNLDLYNERHETHYGSDSDKKSCYVFPDRNPRNRSFLLSKHLMVLTQLIEHLPNDHQVFNSFQWIKEFYSKLYKISNKRLFISGYKLLITAYPNEIASNSYFGITILFENIANNMDIIQTNLIINTLIHCLSDLKFSSFAQKSINVNKVAFIFILNASKLISTDQIDGVIDSKLFKLFFYLLNTFTRTLRSIGAILRGDDVKNKNIYSTIIKSFDILIDYVLKCSGGGDNVEACIPLVLVVSMLLKSAGGKGLSYIQQEKRRSVAKMVISNFFGKTRNVNQYERDYFSLFNLSLVDGLLNSSLRNDVLDALKDKCDVISDIVSSSFISGDLKTAAGGLIVLDYFGTKCSVERKGIEAGVCFEKDVFIRFLCHLTSIKSRESDNDNLLQIGLFGLAQISPQFLQSLSQNYVKQVFKGILKLSNETPFSPFTTANSNFGSFIIHFNVILPLVANDPYKQSLFKGMLSLEKCDVWENKIENMEKTFNSMKIELLNKVEKAEKEHEEIASRYERLEREALEFKNALKSAEKNSDRLLQEERSRFDEAISQTNKQLSKVQSELSTLHKANKELLHERDKLSNEVIEANENAKMLESKLSSYKSKCDSLSMQLKSFNEMSEQFRVLKQEHSRLLNEHSNVSKHFEESFKKLILMGHCFYTLKKDTKEKEEILVQQGHQLSSLHTHLQEREKTINKFESELEQLERLKRELEEQLGRLNAQINQKESLLTKSKAKCEEYRTRIEQLAQTLEHKSRDFQVLQKQIAEKDRDLNGKQQQLRAIANVINDIL